MKWTSVLRAMALCLACFGMLIPTPTLQAATAPAAENGKTPATFDIGLQKDNVLVGQVVNSDGHAQADVPVAVFQGEKPVVTTTTNKSGYFAVSKVPAGTYRIMAGKTQGVYRLWATNTAPPASQPGALIVLGQGPVRAQSGPLAYWLSNPWVLGGIVAAAIAIPVAIHNHQSDSNDPVSN